MPNDDHDNPPTPDDASVVSGADEIERLLDQAESLVSDIAENVGVEPPAGEGLPTPMPDPPDALSVVEMASVQVEELETAVGHEAPSLTGGAASSSDGVGMPDAVRAFESGGAAGSSGGSLSEQPQHSTTRSGGPDITPLRKQGMVDGASRKAHGASIATAVADAVNVIESVRQQTVNEVKEAPTDGETTPAPAPKKSIIRRMLMPIYVALRNIFIAVPNSVLRFFILFDKPLARLSPATKTAIGLIGLVTLIMGVLALILPAILSSDPYSGIKPYAE